MKEPHVVVAGVGIPLGMVVAAMQVYTVSIDLPDFNERISDRPAGRVEQLARQVSNFPDGRREVVVNNDQIIVGIERQMVGIERALGLMRSEGEGFGKGAGNVPE